MNSHRYILASSADALKSAGPFAGTVEAEYGDACVPGELATLAHHGPRQGQECPCLYSGPSLPEIAHVGLSHVDLDTIGGCMRLAGYTPASAEETLFWALAACVDLNGPHKAQKFLDEHVGEFPNAPGYEGERALARWSLRQEAADQAMAMIQAYWAWSQNHRVMAPREGNLDVTEQVREHMNMLLHLFMENSPQRATLLAAGEAWAEAQASLDRESLVAEISTPVGMLLVRSADKFVNHLYGPEGAMVLAYNPERGTVTLSREGDRVPMDCCAVMQAVFGPGAGGHAGIAGSPRDMQILASGLRLAVYKVCLQLGTTLCSCGALCSAMEAHTPYTGNGEYCG